MVGRWQENSPRAFRQSYLPKAFHQSLHYPWHTPIYFRVAPNSLTSHSVVCNLLHRTRDPCSRRNHLREAGHRNDDHKVTIRTLRQWGTRRVLKASHTARRYLSRYVVIVASTRVVLAGVKFVLPQPHVTD